MTENVKFIVTEVNQLLEKNYNLVGFRALDSEDLLQLLSDVLTKIQQSDGSRIDVKNENPEQSSIRIFSSLRILKYQPNVDPVIFRQGLVRGDSETIYPILSWLLTHKDIARQRAYLSRFLVKIEIPPEYSGDPEISALYDQYLSLVDQFKTVHKEREIGKKNDELAAEFTEDLKAMEKEKEAVMLRIEKMKVKAQSASHLLDAARALRIEKDKEHEYALQKEQEAKIISGLQISSQVTERELQSLKRNGNEITPQAVIQQLSEEVTVQTAIMKEKLADEIKAKKNRIAALTSVKENMYIGSEQVSMLRNKLDAITKDVQGLIELKISRNDSDKMEPFRQQAITISNMKRNALERLESTSSRLEELETRLADNREQSKLFIEELVPKGEELKKYISFLKTKSITHKRCAAQLTGLRAENGVLNRTLLILKAQVNQVNEGMKNFEEIKRMIPSNFTSANAFVTNVQLSQTISALRTKLTPLFNEVQAMRKELNISNDRLDQPRRNHSTLNINARDAKSNLLFEVNKAKEKIAKDMEQKERLEKALSKMKDTEKRLEEETNNRNVGQTLKEELNDAIRVEEEGTKSLALQAESSKDQFVKDERQTQQWNQIVSIFSCKIRCAEDSKNNDGVVVRRGGVETLVLQ